MLELGLKLWCGRGSAAEASPPENTVAPEITGTPEIDETLTCSTGTWTGTGTITYARQWRVNGVVIAGETGETFAPDWRYEFDEITCDVSATDDIGTTMESAAGVTVRDAGSTGTTYYVATTGDDGDAGTIGAPFATWQKAFDTVSAGDTIRIAAGNYALPSNYTWKSAGYAVLELATDGTALAPITVKGEPGAVLDFSNITSTSYCHGLLADVEHWHFIDLDFKGFAQDTSGDWLSHVATENGTMGNHLWKRCRSYGAGGVGFFFYAAAAQTLYRCDAFDNWNDKDGGGNADGIQFVDAGAGCKAIECRAWGNSDDGFDCWDTDNRVEFERCWSFENGYEDDGTTAAGDGNGFKLGQNSAGVRHLVQRCLAFDNRNNGFDNNVSSGVNTLYHNTAYGNGGYDYSFDTAVEAILSNNASYSGTVDLHALAVPTRNSWQVIGPLSSGDFESVSSSGMDGARDATGALPVSDFLVPADGSDLVDNGDDLGAPYLGDEPDIGAYETIHTGDWIADPGEWSFVGKAVAIDPAYGGDLTATEPLAAIAGDLEVVAIAYRGNAPFSAPSGWSEACQISTGNTSTDPATSIASSAIFWRVRGATAGDLTFTRSGGNIARTQMMAYRNAGSGTALVTASAETLAANNATASHSGVTTTGQGQLIIALAAFAENGALQSPGANADAPDNSSGIGQQNGLGPIAADQWRARLTGTTTSMADMGHYIFEVVKSGSGATGTITATSAATSRHSMSVAVFAQT